MFVISKYILDCIQFDPSGSKFWETSPLRKWLNGSFLNSAFSEEERIIIPSVTVIADENPDYNKDPGNNTTDQVFILSVTEVTHYFGSDNSRKWCQLPMRSHREQRSVT